MIKSARTGWLIAWVVALGELGTATPGVAQVFGEAARTEFFGGLGVRVFYGRINNTRLLSDGESIANPNGPRVFVNAVSVALVYGLRPGLSLIGVVPSKGRTLKRTVDGGRISETDWGVGDITLLAKYRLYKRDSFSSSRQVGIQAGLKLPTGADDLEDRQGVRFPQPLQLGTGSVDYELALTFTDFRNRLVFTGDLGYSLKTEANDFDFGDVFKYDVAVKFRLYPSRYGDNYPTHDLLLFVEVNGTVAARARSDVQTVADSGGHQIFLAPGVQFFPLENVILEAGLQLPLVDELNGIQLGSSFRFRSGLRWIVAP